MYMYFESHYVAIYSQKAWHHKPISPVYYIGSVNNNMKHSALYKLIIW